MITKVYSYNGIEKCSFVEDTLYINGNRVENIIDIEVNIYSSERIIGATGLFRLPFDFFSYWYKLTFILNGENIIIFLVQNKKNKDLLNSFEKLINSSYNSKIYLYDIKNKKKLSLDKNQLHDAQFTGLQNKSFCELGIIINGNKYQIMNMSLYYYTKLNLLYPHNLISIKKAYASEENIEKREGDLTDEDTNVLHYLYFKICRKYMRIIGNSIFLPLVLIFVLLTFSSYRSDGYINNGLLGTTIVWIIIYLFMYLLYKLILFGIKKMMKSSLYSSEKHGSVEN